MKMTHFLYWHTMSFRSQPTWPKRPWLCPAVSLALRRVGDTTLLASVTRPGPRVKWVPRKAPSTPEGVGHALLSPRKSFSKSQIYLTLLFHQQPTILYPQSGYKVEGHKIGFCFHWGFIFWYDIHFSIWQANICHLRFFTESANLTSYFYSI